MISLCNVAKSGVSVSRTSRNSLPLAFFTRKAWPGPKLSSGVPRFNSLTVIVLVTFMSDNMPLTTERFKPFSDFGLRPDLTGPKVSMNIERARILACG